MFFVRISDWDWPEAPARIPIIPADLPRQDHPLPKALDDPSAAKLLRAAQAEPRMLVRVVVEVLLRTGLRVGEFTALQADAIVLIGAAHWLHVPVGNLREDRYLPLHPHLITLIGDYRTAHVDPGNPLLLPRENGRPLDRHTVTRLINKAGTAAGLTHIHPHQLRHTLATQAINRGMTLEAIAALLGHRSLDMTLRYAKIANRTVADEYFAVTEKVESLYQQGKPNSQWTPAQRCGSPPRSPNSPKPSDHLAGGTQPAHDLATQQSRSLRSANSSPTGVVTGDGGRTPGPAQRRLYQSTVDSPRCCSRPPTGLQVRRPPLQLGTRDDARPNRLQAHHQAHRGNDTVQAPG
jgi:hypothetical protein